MTSQFFLFLLLVSTLSISARSDTLRISNLYQDGMVLQRAPEAATIWGYGTIPDDAWVRVDCWGDRGTKMRFSGDRPILEDGNTWKLILPPQTGGTTCNIDIFEITEAGEDVLLSLKEVLFGDVYLCGGQSNMVFAMNSVYNATQEMEEAKKYTKIRFTRVNRESAELPDDFMDISLAHGWSQPSSQYLASMSAVCFLYAKNIYDQLGVPLGLIDSCIGGTAIECWSTQDGLDVCGIEQEQPGCKETDTIHCNTRLYLSLIHI